MSEVTITAGDVNKLRQMTGAGMMDCKKALIETGGDFEAAVDALRKKGQKVAANRADRHSGEGCVLSKVSADKKFASTNNTFKKYCKTQLRSLQYFLKVLVINYGKLVHKR